MLTEVQENRVVAFRLRYEKRNTTALCQVHEFLRFMPRSRKRLFYEYWNFAFQKELRVGIVRCCRRRDYRKINI